MAVPGPQPDRRRPRAATVVVEARERSGALITADLALDEGREVLAVPGEITSALSRGTNALLRLGATPVTCAADVLEAIGVEPRAGTAPAAARGAAAARARGARRRARRPPTSSRERRASTPAASPPRWPSSSSRASSRRGDGLYQEVMPQP